MAGGYFVISRGSRFNSEQKKTLWEGFKKTEYAKDFHPFNSAFKSGGKAAEAGAAVRQEFSPWKATDFGMIINPQHLKGEIAELRERIVRLEDSIGLKPLPEQTPEAPEPPPGPKPRDPQSLQGNSFGSVRWKRREKQLYG